MQREHKQQSKPSTSILPLTQDAFERPAEVKLDLDDMRAFLKKSYQADPNYTFLKGKDNKAYKTQIEKLCEILLKIGKEYKIDFTITVPNREEKDDEEEKEVPVLDEIGRFPGHLFLMPADSSTPFRRIKEELEKYIYLLQKKIVVDKEEIRKRVAAKFKEEKNKDKEQNAKLLSQHVERQFELETELAQKYELRKVASLAMVLPKILVCSTGIPVYVSAGVEMLTGENTILDEWCQFRTSIMRDFAEKHKARTPDVNRHGGGTHVDLLLNVFAFQEGFGLKTEFNLTDPFAYTAYLNPTHYVMFKNDFHQRWNLRVMADLFANKIVKTFWQIYAYADKEDRQSALEEKWFPYHAEAIACVEENILPLMKVSKDDIQAGNFFEKKEEKVNEKGEPQSQSSLKLSLAHARQLFLKYCQDGHYVMPDVWVEEKNVFSNESKEEQYRLMRAKPLAFSDLGWIEKVTVIAGRTYVDVMPFDTLPPVEKTRYHIWSIIHFGHADHCRLMQTPPTALNALKAEGALEEFAIQLRKQNQFDRHEVLLTSLLKEVPDQLVTLLNIVGIENAKKILDVVDIDWQWTLADDFPWIQTKEHKGEPESKALMEEPLVKHAESRGFTKLATMLRDHLKNCRAAIHRFQQEHKLEVDKLPIRYSALVQIADQSKPEDSLIFKIHMRHHNYYMFRRMKEAGLDDYAKEFLSKYMRTFANNNSIRKNKLYGYIKDGDVDALKKLHVVAEELHPWINTHVSDHSSPQMMAHLYQLCCDGVGEKKPALGVAVLLNQVEVVKARLAAKENPDEIEADQRHTALHVAAENNLLHLVKILLAAGADINAKARGTEYTPLMLAAQEGCLAVVQLLLEQGADVNFAAGENGETALNRAVRQNAVEITRMLLAHQAVVNTARFVTKPLILAAKHGRSQIMALLIEHGANVNLLDDQGKTALHEAAQYGQWEIVVMLLHAKADATLQWQGKTPAQCTTDPRIKHLLLTAEFAESVKEIKDVFTHYQLMQPLPLVFRDSGAVGWVAGSHGELIEFDKLPADEKIRYHLYSIRHYGTTDFCLLARDGKIDEKNYLPALAKMMDSENQLDKYAGFFNLLFEDNLNAFIRLLKFMQPNTVMKVFDQINIDIRWMCLQDRYHHVAVDIYDELVELPVFKEALEARYQSLKNINQTFLRRCKIPLNITKDEQLKEMLAHADEAKPEEQVLYRNYLRRYHPREFVQTAAEVKVDYAQAFKKAEKNSILPEPDEDEIFSAIRANNRAAVQARLSEGVPVNSFLKSGVSLLGYAAYHGMLDIVHRLLGLGADVNVGMGTRHNPLLCAVQLGHIAMARLLVERSANVNVCDEQGFSVLHLAAIMGNLEMVQLLLQAGANPHAKAKNKIPAQYAKTPEIKNLLLNASAKQIDDIPQVFANESLRLRCFHLGEGVKLATIETKSGAEVKFSELSKAEQTRYYQYSILHYDLSDRFQLTSESSFDFAKMFPQAKDVQELGQMLEKQNQFSRHTSFLRSLFRRDPAYFVDLVSAMRSENMFKLFEIVEMEFHLLHSPSDLKAQANLVDKLLQGVHKEQFALRVKELKTSLRVPRTYHDLLARVDKSKPKYHALFKFYARHYYPEQYQAASLEGKPDYQKVFKMGHQERLKKISPDAHKFVEPFLDGDLKKLDKLSFENQHMLADFIPFGRSDALRQLYQKAKSSVKADLVLMVAIEYGQINDFAVLARDDMLDKINPENGCAPCHMAAIMENLEIMRILIERGVNLDVVSNDNHTPLMIAIIREQFEMVQLLCAAGVNVNMEKARALYYAGLTGHIDILQCLLDHGADIDLLSPSEQTQISGNPKVKRALFICEVEKAVKRLAEMKSSDLGLAPGIFATPTQSQLISAGEKLLQVLRSEDPQVELEKSKAELDNIFKVEPWSRLYQAARALIATPEKKSEHVAIKSGNK